MLRTAPPEAIEQAHAEAFARLTPEQRRMVLERVRDALPEAEHEAVTPVMSDPRELARYATGPRSASPARWSAHSAPCRLRAVPASAA
jgi:acyl-CoA reductase-like NAD-dependent aldehyde dehydrogenase